MQIAVLVACHNRAQTTCKNLTNLTNLAKKMQDLCLKIFLVDDNSTDGTGELIRENLPDITLIQGDGSLFWNRGMCLAYDHARNAGKYDAYLIFNDDVQLIFEPFRDLLYSFVAENKIRPTTLVGSMKSLETGQVTYSGWLRQSSISPLRLKLVLPNGVLQPCDTFNGNCVLIPRLEMDRLNGLDSHYHHFYGDIDLGYSLGRGGVSLLVSSAPVGYCELNPIRDRLAGKSLKSRLRGLISPPLPVGDYVHFAYKHSNWTWASILSLKYTLERVVQALVPISRHNS